MYDTRFLIIAAVIVIGITIAFQAMVDEEIQADRNREMIQRELIDLSKFAQLVYKQSMDNGCGSKGTFGTTSGGVADDILLQLNKINLDSNYYSIDVSKNDYLLLCGIGYRKYEDKPVEVHVHVWPESTKVDVIN